jgi:hypothetical protein
VWEGLGALPVKVKSWSEFQHYKNRRPPWIKLHHELLDNYDFNCLPVASRALAPMIWLLASESSEGTLPADLEQMSFRLHQTQNELLAALKPLIAKGFLVLEKGDSELLAERKQDAMLEESREETYKQETEGESEIQSQQPPLNCARRLMEILSLPQTPGFLRTVEAAIVAEAGFCDMSPADAAQQISTHAMEFRRKEGNLDKFYFEDTKWRNGNGNRKSQPSKAERRTDIIDANIIDGFRKDISRRDAPDGPKLKVGAGQRLSG